MNVSFHMLVCLLAFVYEDVESSTSEEDVTIMEMKLDRLEKRMKYKDEQILLLEMKMSEQAKYLKSMASTLTDQGMKVAHLETTLANQDKKVAHLESTVAEQDKKEAHLEASLTDQKKKVAHLESTCLASVENGIDEEKHVTHITGSREVNATRVYRPRNEYMHQLNKRVPETPQLQVAFHVYLSANRDLAIGATLIYDHESLDLGNGYNPLDGTYTAPVSGTYVLTWTTVSYVNSYYSVSLVVNGIVEGRGMADAELVSDIHSGTGLVVLVLNQGDHIFLRVFKKSGKVLGGTTSYARTTFSGWVL